VHDGGVLVINNLAIRLPDPLCDGSSGSGARTSRLARLVVERPASLWGRNTLPLEDRMRSMSGAGGERAAAARVTERLLSVFDLPALIRWKKANYGAFVERVIEVPGVYIPVPVLSRDVRRRCSQFVSRIPCAGAARCGGWASVLPGAEADAVREIALDEFPVARLWSAQGLLLPVNEGLNDRHFNWIARALHGAGGPRGLAG